MICFVQNILKLLLLIEYYHYLLGDERYYLYRDSNVVFLVSIRLQKMMKIDLYIDKMLHKSWWCQFILTLYMHDS